MPYLPPFSGKGYSTNQLQHCTLKSAPSVKIARELPLSQKSPRPTG
jgi:hypothetical protein